MTVTPTTSKACTTERERRKARTAELLDAARSAHGVERKRLLDEVIVMNMGVARSIALRYRGRGIATDDLEQVAHAALVRCVHNFDPDSADDLLSYAVPSIRGEVRRYFRDHGWMVRPPRRIQELQSLVVGERARLGADGRSGGAEAIAQALGVEVADVTDALAAQGCFQPVSLDLPVADDAHATLGDLLDCGSEADPFSGVEARATLTSAIRSLSERDRRLIKLRFFDELTQSEIAAEFGVTQTQVSRLLGRVLTNLRALIEEPESTTRPRQHRRTAA